MADDYRVLLVDDDPAMLRLLAKWLRDAGYPTRTVLNGHEAREAIEQECPDFIITDWEMPEVNGLELCRGVREMSLPHYVYMLFLTVKTAPEEIIAGLEVGADDFLGKPVSEGELLARMRSGSRVLQLERRLSLMANTDSLTNLLTQRCFYDSLEKEWRRSRRSHRPLSCVMIDLDFFKQINDVHGHSAGDTMLKSVADLLLDNCRTSDVICRYGGEEFCILLPDTDEIGAANWAERMRHRLADLHVSVRRRELRITGSFGISEILDGMQNAEELVDMADQALLCAKCTGRNKVVRCSTLIDASKGNSRAEDQLEIFKGVLARDVMDPLTSSLGKNQTIGEAVRFFLEAGESSTPVIDENGGLAGFLSEKDVMAAMVSPDCWRRPVCEIMRTNVISYEESSPIQIIHDFLCRVSIRGVVITKDGSPVGTISRNSLLRWFRDLVERKGLVLSPVTEKNLPAPESLPSGQASPLVPGGEWPNNGFQSAETAGR